MRNISFKYYVEVALMILGVYALADHPNVVFSTGGAGPVTTISARPMPSGSWSFGIQTQVINHDEFRNEELEDFAFRGLDGVHSVDEIRSTSFSAAYGVTNNLSISARLPYIEREDIREGELGAGVPETHTHGDSSGFGDLMILGQYRINQTITGDVAVHLARVSWFGV